MKFFASFVAIVFAFSLPFAAAAQSAVVPVPSNSIIPGQQSATSSQSSQAQELSQIQTIQQELAQVQEQITGSSGGTSAGTGTSCSAIVATLGPGSSGAGVTQLQTFLAQNPAIYPQGLVTGYYGSLTTAAVQAFQTKNGIVSSGTPSTTGYGQVGPQTAAAIQAQCGGGTSGATGTPAMTATKFGGFIQVSPVSGDTPLYVNVQATINTTSDCGSSLYTLDWGDGSPQQVMNVAAGACSSEQQTYTHTYQDPGTYSITLAAGNHSSTATVVAQ